MSDERGRGDKAAPADTDLGRERWLDRLMQLFGSRARESIRGDLEDALSETIQADDFTPAERAMLKNVLGFHRVRVSDVMVPRADIIAISSDTSLGDLMAVFRTAGHSRLPVFGETLDDPLGMVHIRDFLDLIARRAEAKVAIVAEGIEASEGVAIDAAGPANLGEVDLSETLTSASILRPVLFVPPSMRAVDLLLRMQTKRTHIALVIDEYGGTEGLVSIEDIVETVVGDIEDEHDDPTDAMVVKAEDGAFLADARASLEDVSTALGADLAANDVADEIDTLGGLIVTLAGRVPSRGELIAGPGGFEFEVLDADPRRLKRVKIHRRAAADTPAGEPDDLPPAASPLPSAPETGAPRR